MILLGHNLLPYSVAQLGSGWAGSAANGIIANCFFFDSDINAQGNFSQHLADMRNLYNNAVAATTIVLRPIQEGLLLLSEQQEGWKARSGSIYFEKNGATIHYPVAATPVGYNGASAVNIQTAYGQSLDAGNKALWGVGPAGYRPWSYAGVPHDTIAPSSHLSTTDLTFESAVSIDSVVSDQQDITTAASGTIAPIGSDGKVGTAISWSIAANQEGNMLPSATPSSNKFRFIQTAGTRRVLPTTTADVTNVPGAKKVRWAIVVIQDTSFGALANGNYIPTYFVAEVGAINSGAPIELFSTMLQTGEFASVAQVRTSTEV